MYPTNQHRVWEELGTSRTDGLHVFIHIKMVRDGGHLWSQWPPGPLLTPGLRPRGLLLQITFQTSAYYSLWLKVNHKWVLVLWVYVIIKRLGNRCLGSTVTNNASCCGLPALVTPWDSQTSLAWTLDKTAPLHLALGLWVQAFLFTTINGCQTKVSDDFVSRDPLSLDSLF